VVAWLGVSLLGSGEVVTGSGSANSEDDLRPWRPGRRLPPAGVGPGRHQARSDHVRPTAETRRSDGTTTSVDGSALTLVAIVRAGGVDTPLLLGGQSVQRQVSAGDLIRSASEMFGLPRSL